MNLFFLKLCWKNIWRNKRRTWITANAIGVAVMTLVWVFNYYDAFHDQLIANGIRYQSGHALMTHPEYPKHKNTSRFIRQPKQLLQWLHRHPLVVQYSPSVLGQGLISSAKGSANIVFKGVEPVHERKTTQFAASITKGRFLSPKKNGIVIGMRLAELLGLSVGSKAVILTQGVDGSIGNELFYIEGIFSTQSEADASLVFVKSEAARGLLSLPVQAIHQVAILLHRESTLPMIAEEFRKQPFSHHVLFRPWTDIQTHLMAIIELDKSANRILMLLILFVAVLGIVNSTVMSIFERKREFGVMMSIGTTQNELIGMLAMETFLLTTVGVLVGNILGACITLYFQQHGFDLGWLTDRQLVVGGALIDTISYPRFLPANSLTITAVIMIFSFIATLIPIRHVSKLNTLSALRSV